MSFQLMNLRNNTNVSSKKKPGKMYVLKKNSSLKRKNFNLINVRNGDLEHSLSNISEDQEVLQGMVHSNQSEISLHSLADDSQEEESSFVDEYDETDDESFNESYEVSLKYNNMDDHEEDSNQNENITLSKIKKEEKSNAFPQNSIMDAISTTLNTRDQVIVDSSSDSESMKEYDNDENEEELEDDMNDEEHEEEQDEEHEENEEHEEDEDDEDEEFDTECDMEYQNDEEEKNENNEINEPLRLERIEEISGLEEQEEEEQEEEEFV